MKKLLLLLLLPLYVWAGVDGVWKSGAGEYWVVLHEAGGMAYALQFDPTLTRSTLWGGSLSGSALQLSSATGSASLSTSTDGTSLSGTVAGQSFSAASLAVHFGSGYDGVYTVSGSSRYLVYLTVKEGSGTAVLLLDLSLSGGTLSHQVYWGHFNPGTRKMTAASLTSAGATADMSFDDSGNASGKLKGVSFTAASLIYQALPETDSDFMGYSTNSIGYSLMAGKGMKVVNLPEEESFFAFYIPSVVQKDRIMVVVHGTDGTPYEEIKDEREFADQYGYIVLGIQWHNKTTGEYATGTSVHRIIGKALDHLKRTRGNDLSRVAYVGFSRGSAVSYEVTWRDLQSRKLFDLTISHSGGIPLTLAVTQDDTNPDAFFGALSRGELGATAMSGSKFFLYCGQRDEQWGTEMCEQIHYADTLIRQNGGTVVRLIDDPSGTHGGYRTTPAYHTAGVQAFIDATP